ncbi:MAG: hypothetical protein ACREM1_01775, partial [Longimicrobiales bacterium]
LFFSAVLTLPSMAIQVMAPNQMRGQLVGAFTLLTGLLGYGLGPVLAGFLSDRLGDLPLALAIMLGVTCPAAAVIAVSGLSAYERLARDAAAMRDRHAAAV